MMKATSSNSVFVGLGIFFLAYALLGNYVALPGYLRFLARGETSAAGNAFDLDVAIGAAKTIVWMFSFQLGVLCLAVAHARNNNLLTLPLTVCVIIWLALWSWPTLPAPGAVFYVVFGTSILLGISFVLGGRIETSKDRLTRTLFLGSLVFFAFATWEVCGLGSTGRMLHPEEAQAPLAHNILVTQSSKLMIEFVFAWGLLAASLYRARIPGV